ncbi:MAG: histidine kinase [Betaproteobacteria bacterium HGW-Betaproteobacteria-13]|jgi:HD-like signal output (HDOD) protein|nr:MAG: histidine kinase [Betaproteobacteria bacterium HGW-Betaproteobacteria-19]PKO80663.1 MAG: histidine kinase [Betaproteobacteria bacterium HGW-Betaproteobacteria-13]
MNEFEQQASAFADTINAELSDGRLVFPVSMEVTLRIKRLADDPDSSLDEIVAVVQAEPVLAAKTIRMANTVALNPYGALVDSVGVAVRRIGLSSLRSLAFAVASEQLAGDHRSPNMRTLAQGLWMRSLDVASWCFALARRTQASNPDTALMAGMLTQIGQFFLIARASDYPAMERNIDRFAELVDRLHVDVGRAVLDVFDVPESILDGLDAENGYTGTWPPADLHHIVQIASMVSEYPDPLDGLLGRHPQRGPATTEGFGIDPAELQSLLHDSQDERRQILEAVRG